jgi:excinuclease ABC subunit A
MSDSLIIKGAREHNLKNISLELPRDELIVFTGLSGSGKSSLAFDTIYAEGQRRYVESLSSYARQFLGQMDKPDVDFIEGLSPAIAIDQKSTSHNPRSTVGTVTEIYDYLRLLYARIGKPHCPNCSRLITKQSPQQIVDWIMTLEHGTRFYVLAPVVRGRKGEYVSLLDDLAKSGYTRVIADGVQYDLRDRAQIELGRYEQHYIQVIVDRLVLGDDITRRLTDSLETAFKLAEGTAEILLLSENDAVTPRSGQGKQGTKSKKGKPAEAEQENLLVFSENFACPYCQISIPELTPRSFSFNSPYGACPECSGLGTVYEVDPELVITDPVMSIQEGVIAPWAATHNNYFTQLLKSVCENADIPMNLSWEKLSSEQQGVLLYGTGVQKRLPVTFKSRFGGTRRFDARFEGVIPWLQRRRQEVESDRQREQIESYMREIPCPKCNGARLSKEVLGVTVGEINIADLSSLSIKETFERISSFNLDKRDQLIAERLLKEILSRLQFLIDVGLDYLSLTRSAATLAGGEAQRIRLASQIGSGLVGVLYVLDEPSIGLHQRDNHKLISTLLRLKNLGNTVIVVEHDEDMIRSADYLVDIGPAAGEHGGEVVVAGSLSDVIAHEASITGSYLSGKRRIEVPEKRRPTDKGFIGVKGAAENNLKDIDVDFPLGVMTAVTGVSGSGKSTLVNEILLRSVMQKIYKSKLAPGRHRSVVGVEKIDKVVDIDQSPIGRTPRSNPATYIGVFDHIRKLFAATNEAKIRGYQPGRFSFNVPGGRCEACSGDGTIKIEMHFLPDVYVPCELCNGTRYNRDTLEVLWKGHNIADILNMPCAEALEVFGAQTSITRYLSTLVDVGLGYIRLGQSAPTLSGGEAQRVKLAAELSKKSTSHTLYILDEPTTGLHFEDVAKLLEVLQKLVDQGNTIIVIEHNLDVIKTSDYVIDLGPEGGIGGGTLVATGTPEEVAAVAKSYTGLFLKPLLAKESTKKAVEAAQKNRHSR